MSEKEERKPTGHICYIDFVNYYPVPQGKLDLHAEGLNLTESNIHPKKERRTRLNRNVQHFPLCDQRRENGPVNEDTVDRRWPTCTV